MCPLGLGYEKKTLNDLNYRAESQEIIKQAVLLINGQKKEYLSQSDRSADGQKRYGDGLASYFSLQNQCQTILHYYIHLSESFMRFTSHACFLLHLTQHLVLKTSCVCCRVIFLFFNLSVLLWVCHTCREIVLTEIKYFQSSKIAASQHRQLQVELNWSLRL